MTDTRSAEWLHEHTAEALDRVAGGGGPMVITRDWAAAVVVVDMAEFEGIRAAKERAALLALRAMGRDEVARGEVMTVDEARRLSAGWFAG